MAFLDQFSNFLSGSPAQTQQLARFLPQQQQGLLQALDLGLAGLQQNRFNFDPIAQVARTQFSTQTVPSILEQFTGAGGSRSSALQGALASAGSGLEQQLAAMRSNYGLQQQSQLLDLLRTGLTPSFENIYIPATGGFGQAAAPALGYGMAQLFNQFLQSQNQQPMADTGSQGLNNQMNRQTGGFRGALRKVGSIAPGALSAFGPWGTAAGVGLNAATSFL